MAGLRTAPEAVTICAAHIDLDATYDAAIIKQEITFSYEKTVFSSV